MVGAGNPALITVRIVAALVDITERRAEVMATLSPAVARAVSELDPDGLRDSRPTWWTDLPAWVRLDSFDRLRRSHDQLRVLETQAQMVVEDLAGFVALTEPGCPGRPLGYTPDRARVELVRMAGYRRPILTEMGKAEHALTRRLEAGTSASIRLALREMIVEDVHAEAQLGRLDDLIGA